MGNRQQRSVTDLASEDSPSNTASRSHRAIAFALYNVLIVACFALFHSFSPAADLLTQFSYRSYICWIVLEALILFLPALVVYGLVDWYSNRTATFLCVVTTLLISIVYCLDFALVLFLREHLISHEFWGLFLSVLPHILDFITRKHCVFFLLGTLSWIGIQLAGWKLATWLLTPRGLTTRTYRSAAICLAGTVSFIFLYYVSSPFTRFEQATVEIVRASDRHPISAIGVFHANQAPRFNESTLDAIRGQAWILDNIDQPAIFAKQFDGFRIQRAREDRNELPDVMLIVSECLRADAITRKTTPNIHAQAQRGLWLQQHYSAGNHSKFAFFGLMYGLDACWYEQKAELPVALFESLKQSGYTTGFFGRDCFNTFGMEDFCGEHCFDMHDFVDSNNFVECDKAVCQSAAEFFDRTGKFADHSDSPRLAIVYLYSPHTSGRQFEPEDDIHSAEDAFPFTPPHMKRECARFLNSVHFVDRTIAPLFRDDCITFILGDHGESFGDDRRAIHGTASSTVQLQTCCVGFGPGIKQQIIIDPTWHCDILPTLFELLAIKCSHSDLFPGVSLLDGISEQRLISCRDHNQSRILIVQPSRRLGDKVLGYLGFLEWRRLMLAPGAMVDTLGDAITETSMKSGRWEDADLMLNWLRDRIGERFAEIPPDPVPLLRKSISHQDREIRFKSLQLIEFLGSDGNVLIEDVRTRLSDPDPTIRENAFRLIQQFQHRE